MENSEFNPYCQWLDLPAEPQDFYGLLGLKPFESDTELIRRVSLRLTSTVRNIKPGDHTSDWMKLLDQIEQAQQTLCDPNQKSRYDRALRETGASRPLPGNAPASFESGRGVDPMAPITSSRHEPVSNHDRVLASPPLQRQAIPLAKPAIAAAPITPSSSVIRGRKRTRRNQRSLSILVVLAVGIFAIGGLLVLPLLNQDPSGKQLGQTSSDPSPATASSQPEATIVRDADSRKSTEANLNGTDKGASRSSENSGSFADQVNDRGGEGRLSENLPGLSDSSRDKRDRPSLETPRPDTVDSSNPEPIVENVPSPTAAEIVQLKQLVAAGHLALDRREFQKCDTLISQARQLPLDDAGESLLERLATLHEYVVEYHQAIQEGLQDIEGEELTLNETMVYVVEANDSTLVLRVLGENRRYDRSDLPTGLAMAIADRWFDQGAASTKVFKGAFMAVTPRFSEADVRAIWTKAAAEGVDLGDLMQVLDDRKTRQATANSTGN